MRRCPKIKSKSKNKLKKKLLKILKNNKIKIKVK